MKLTVEIPDDLFRGVKAKCVRERRSIRAVAMELFSGWVVESPTVPEERPFVSAYELMKDVVGIVDSRVEDLATNPAYLEDFGRDSMGHR